VLLPIASWADTHTAASCSLTDVTSAYNAASSGDTVAVPPGNCTWSGTLTINKSISLIGAGAGSTKITWGYTPLISLDLSADRSIRVSGFYFDMVQQSGRIAIAVTANGASGLRIDHNTFNQGGGSSGPGVIDIEATIRVYGVIDSNTFINGTSPIFYDGPSDYEWNRATIQAGTANALFIEDNTFTVDNGSADKDPDAVIYVQEGASTVIRYNTFDAHAFTSGDFHWLNHHGNQEYYPGRDRSFRGQAISEIYNNTVSFHHSYVSPGGLRGGSIIAYNNTVTCIGGTSCPAHIFNLREEECNQPSFFSPLRTQWPAQDQIFNSFFWNNTYNGSLDTGFEFQFSRDTDFIQQNRDYFMHAPEASGGYEYFTGSRKGGSTTAPTQTDTGSMAFSTSGANAYYPYTTYIYPHPLRGAAIQPQPPQHLRIVN
jgi:hypothetical protein